MKFCRTCGTEMKDDDLVCINCGMRDEQADEPVQEAPNFQSGMGNLKPHAFESGVKFCAKCGNKLHQDAVICPSCGCVTENSNREGDGGYTADGKKSSTMITVIKILMILSCVAAGVCGLLPLAWCLPMTLHAIRKMEKGEKLSTTFKICTLLFVNLIPGILMLCDENL